MTDARQPVLPMIRRCLFVVTAAAAIGSTASAVLATPLDPGVTEYNPTLVGGFAFFVPNYVAGPLPANYVLVTSRDVPYNYNGTANNAFFGFVRSSVWRNSATGQLAFEYVFNNLTPPTPPNPPLTDIVRATINDPTRPWIKSKTNAPFTIFAVGSDPNSGGHSTPINGVFGGWNNGVPFDLTRSSVDSGVAVEFNPLFSGTQLNSTPNDQSATVWFATDATAFSFTNVGLSANGDFGTSQAFAPDPSISPEPSTFILAIIGCCAGWFAIRRGRVM